MDAAVGVGVWALQEQPVIGHHDVSGCSQVHEEYFSGDAAAAAAVAAAAGAHIVVVTSDRSGSFCDHRAAGHRGGKFSFPPTYGEAGVCVCGEVGSFPAS